MKRGKRLIALTALLAVTQIGLSHVALAHDEVVEAFESGGGAGLPEGVPLAGIMATTALFLFVGAHAVSRLAGGSRVTSLRYSEALAAAMLAWLLLGFLQNATPGFTVLLNAGYVVLPFALATAWIFVFANFRPVLRGVLRAKRYWFVAAAGAVVFATFYLWSTNLVAPPEPEEMPGPGTEAFVIPYWAYGPLAIWPNVEFWIPQLKLLGAVSVGTGMLVLTLAPLMGLNIALLTHGLGQRTASLRGGTTLGGGAVMALGTNFCCCCAPAIYPIMAVVVGSTTASSLAVWMIGSASPLYNLTQVATLSLSLVGMGLISRRTWSASTWAHYSIVSRWGGRAKEQGQFRGIDIRPSIR